jgi:hypothetical protein
VELDRLSGIEEERLARARDTQVTLKNPRPFVRAAATAGYNPGSAADLPENMHGCCRFMSEMGHKPA